MATGYEVQMYQDVRRIAVALELIADRLQKVVDGQTDIIRKLDKIADNLPGG